MIVGNKPNPFHPTWDQRGGRMCVLSTSMSTSWDARGKDNARTVLITIGQILTGQTPTKLG